MENFEMWIDQEQEYIPHYERLKEEMQDKVLSDLQNLTGITFTTTFPPSTGAGGFLPDNYLPPAAAKEYSWPVFLREIGQAGHRKKALAYLDYEIQELTLGIKEHPFSGGHIMPQVFRNEDHAENFWEEVYNSTGDQESGEEHQRLEIMRLHRSWMVTIRQRLFVDRAMATEPAALPRSPSRQKKEITFAGMFVTPGTGDMLDDILRSSEIGWLHRDGSWISGATEIGALFYHLQKEGLLTSEACKLSNSKKCEILIAHFKQPVTPQHFGNTLKNCAESIMIKKEVLDKCDHIVKHLKITPI